LREKNSILKIVPYVNSRYKRQKYRLTIPRIDVLKPYPPS
jgi:hypothetical protein